MHTKAIFELGGSVRCLHDEVNADKSHSTIKNIIIASTTMNISFHSFLSGFSKAFRRFPAAAFFFVLLTIFAIYAFYDSPDDEVLFLMLYYPATAAMLNILLRLLA